MSFWTPAELDRFSYFKLDDIRSPGVLQLPQMGEGIPITFQVAQGFGLSGATQRNTGLGLAEWSFTIWCIDAESRTALDAADWREATAPPPQGVPSRRRRIKHNRLGRTAKRHQASRIKQIADFQRKLTTKEDLSARHNRQSRFAYRQITTQIDLTRPSRVLSQKSPIISAIITALRQALRLSNRLYRPQQ
mgnify:CR=1 FL=1